jgi:hypothetical protein
VEGVGFTAARARADVNWYTSFPTVPLSYLLGRLEVERLHAQLVGREGWSLQQFNDWMLSHGAIRGVGFGTLGYARQSGKRKNGAEAQVGPAAW